MIIASALILFLLASPSTNALYSTESAVRQTDDIGDGEEDLPEFSEEQAFSSGNESELSENEINPINKRDLGRNVQLDSNTLDDPDSDQEGVREKDANYIRLGRNEGDARNYDQHDSIHGVELTPYEDDAILLEKKKAGSDFVRLGRSNDNSFVRFGRGKPDNFLRFGKSNSDSFLRYGKSDSFVRLGRNKPDSFLRFGKGKPENFLRFGRDKSENFLRFGREKPGNFLRFGKGNPDNFVRFGRDKSGNFLRFGRDKPGNFLRFGREKPDNFLRFGKDKLDNFVRFGRSNVDNFLRFGKGKDDSFVRLGRGKSDGFVRFGRDRAAEDFERSQRGKGNDFLRFGRGGPDNLWRMDESDENSELDVDLLVDQSVAVAGNDYPSSSDEGEREYVRITRGNGDNSFLRLGRSGNLANGMNGAHLSRLRRNGNSNTARFGRGKLTDSNFIRLGRSSTPKRSENLSPEAGRKESNIIRLGRSVDPDDLPKIRASSNPYVRFGRSAAEDNHVAGRKKRSVDDVPPSAIIGYKDGVLPLEFLVMPEDVSIFKASPMKEETPAYV